MRATNRSDIYNICEHN